MNTLLQAALTKQGIDIKAKVKTPHGMKDRFVWLAWGQETSLSMYSYTQNVVFAGVIHRPELDIAGSMVGQSGDLKKEVSGVDVHAVRMSEVSHSVYQAMNRAACRQTLEGQAVKTNVWLPLWHWENVRNELIDVMPGLQWCQWDSKSGTAKKTQRDVIVDKVISYLNSLSHDVEKVTISALKAATDLTSVNLKTFSRAMNELEDKLTDMQWEKSGRSLIRLK